MFQMISSEAVVVGGEAKSNVRRGFGSVILAGMLLGAAALGGGCDESTLSAANFGYGGYSDYGYYGYDDGGYSDSGYDAGDAIETYLGNFVVY